MSVKATHRVKDSNNKTVGFIVNGNYTNYYNAVKNINLIDNLILTSKGAVRSKEGELPVQSIRIVNEKRYNQLCMETPLVRDVQTELGQWKKNWHNKVLYVSGARQTGKTTEIFKFAYNNYEQIIYVNLADRKQLESFESAADNTSVLFGLIQYCRESDNAEFCNSDKTVLIIDEIQESSDIYNSIRALQGGLSCDIIVTGSYLGKTLNAKYFKPAGNTYDIEMLPLSFREFCRAFQKEELLMHISLYGKSASTEYETLTKLYRIYKRIGGYPAVVRTYLETKDVASCHKELQSILGRFTEESASYFQDTKCGMVFQNVYKAAFIAMTKEKRGTSAKDIKDITEFIRNDTNEHVSRREVNDAISWLKFSKILGGCDLYNQGNVADLLSERRFYFMDCGIAMYLAQQTPLSNETVEGILAENFVYTELYRVYKENRLKGDKPCCSVYNEFELDFMLVDRNDKRYGIEVKSENSAKHRSLDKYLENEFIDEAYLAEITRGGIGRQIRSIPIYTVGCRFPYEE